jgi:predicted transcriptional regulator
MDLSSGDISSMIFRRTVKIDLGGFSLDRQALNIYMQLNGAETLGQLAEKVQQNLAYMRGVISNLLSLGLIEEIQQDIVMLDGDFFRYLINQLSLATGPIASVLIEDEIHDLGYEIDQFPAYRARDLVGRLAVEIRREEKKSAFTSNMVSKIRQKGYPYD